MSNVRKVLEGVQEQGVDESLSYGITTTPWGSTPTSISVVVKDVTDPYNVTVVTDDVTSGSPSAAGDVITLPKLLSLTVNHKYRVETKFTDSDSNIWEAWFEVLAVL